MIESVSGRFARDVEHQSDERIDRNYMQQAGERLRLLYVDRVTGESQFPEDPIDIEGPDDDTPGTVYGLGDTIPPEAWVNKNVFSEPHAGFIDTPMLPFNPSGIEEGKKYVLNYPDAPRLQVVCLVEITEDFGPYVAGTHATALYGNLADGADSLVDWPPTPQKLLDFLTSAGLPAVLNDNNTYLMTYLDEDRQFLDFDVTLIEDTSVE